MVTHDLEDRLESAIRHINTSIDIDPWAQSLAVESMRIRIAMLKTGQPETIRCKDCKYGEPNGKYGCTAYHYKLYEAHAMKPNDFCSHAERKTDG